ncbi:MAG TPA: hypothetical protein DCZ01_01150 [Elusimicrobia bacterium]|nr:MAG: hypothetical protein A2X37_03250 [Elusimicrobia bacterium GWA2_66_18]OGR70344.1 MAG: hypothetical protein A2X40_04205 [Elusimicrobia bacterium GWC2_65_9]HAZ07140.1 hypothetical protein [Elusimicrobiota bacterium]
MIIALLLAAAPLHAQIISPGLCRVVSAPIAVPLPIVAVSASAASLNYLWDGPALGQIYEVPATPVPLSFEPQSALADRGRPAPWLSVRDPNLARALDAAVDLARGTALGRRTFAAAQEAVAAQGGVLVVAVRDLGKNNGEFDYLAGRLSLNRALFAPGREVTLAGTLVHELLHVVQHAAGLPSYALELELEAHLQDLEMLAELGLTPPPDTFARQTLDALAQSPAAFVELIQAAVPGSPYLGEDSLDEVIDWLEEDLESARERGPSSARLARSIEADLENLRTEAGAAAYLAFSRRVRALLARRCAAAKG